VKLLLDTQIALFILAGSLLEKHAAISKLLSNGNAESYLSVASLWEIAIKARLGKLSIDLPFDALVGFFESVGLKILAIEARHVVALAKPEPITRDPFDRLLLAQCQVEGLTLVTIDKALIGHRLAAWT
jgi:PIN domain nuclease of toxin-antitoxin system